MSTGDELAELFRQVDLTERLKQSLLDRERPFTLGSMMETHAGLPPGAGAEMTREMTRLARERRSESPHTKRLSDGSTGYFMRRHDDCWQAAVATVLQVPMRELPDSRIDERLRAGESAEEITRSADEEMERWLADHSLRATVHTDVPLDEDRWLGYVPVLGAFQSHCLVMARDQLAGAGKS